MKSLQSTTEESAKAAMRAPIDDAFGFAKDGLFGVLLRSIGGILGGAVELGAGALTWVVDGVVGLIDGVARAIGNLFGGGGQSNPPPPPPPIFNPIRTNLEKVLEPKFDEVDRLLEDARGIGDDQKTINEEMRELLDPDNENSELWKLQTDYNALNDEQNAMKLEMIEINRDAIAAQQEFIPRTLIARDDRTVFDDYLRVVPSGGRLHIEALEDSPHGAWTGEMLLQSSYPSGTNNYSPVTEFTEIPTGNPADPRWVNWPGGNHNFPVINYWVRQAKMGVHDRETGVYDSAPGSWTQRSELVFTAPDTAEYDLFYRVVWDATTWDDTYSTRVRRNGSTIMQWGPATRVGPVGFWESGVRTRIITEVGVALNEGDTLVFETYSNANNGTERRVRRSDTKISWMIPATEENM